MAQAALRNALQLYDGAAHCLQPGEADTLTLRVTPASTPVQQDSDSAHHRASAAYHELTDSDVAHIIAACGAGVCAPSLSSFVVHLAAPLGEEQTGVVNLPDATTMIVIPVPRGALTRTTTQATFASGLAQETGTTQPSEALAVVSLPLTIVRAVFGTVTEVFQLRINIDTRDRALAAHNGAAAAAAGGPTLSTTPLTLPDNPRGTTAYAPVGALAPTATSVFMAAGGRGVTLSDLRAAQPQPPAPATAAPKKET
jgi:hypothetical protein